MGVIDLDSCGMRGHRNFDGQNLSVAKWRATDINVMGENTNRTSQFHGFEPPPPNLIEVRVFRVPPFKIRIATLPPLW